MTNKIKTENLYPLTYMRPPEELICGAMPIKENLSRLKRDMKYPWDLISHFKEDLEEDFKHLKLKIFGLVHKSAVLINKKAIHIGKGAEISACAVLDASHGPIYIGSETIVHPHSLLRGPLYIGKNCRIAGEIVHSIIMDYVNKGHYGFIGHSYICPWANLGAGTTNSNLKNNYSSVKVYVNGKMIDSGQMFLGCFIGDHAKTGIGTLINAGSVIGVGTNVFGAGLTPKYIPNFTWGNNQKYEWDKFIECARKVYLRRGKKLSKDAETLLRSVYNI